MNTFGSGSVVSARTSANASRNRRAQYGRHVIAYVAVVLDAWSRRVVGWAMASHVRTELVVDALEMALERRRPDGVVAHSDHGSQCTSLEYGRRCSRAGVQLSMGTVGDCYDNAMCESFFASLECELIDRTTFRTREQARMGVFDYIEG
jgi:putative transposase